MELPGFLYHMTRQRPQYSLHHCQVLLAVMGLEKNQDTHFCSLLEEVTKNHALTLVHFFTATSNFRFLHKTAEKHYTHCIILRFIVTYRKYCESKVVFYENTSYAPNITWL